MQRHRLTSVHSLLLAGAVSGALAAPAPALVARDATVSAAPVRATIDLRSPDARDAGRPVAFDLRSPDAALPVSLPAAQPRLAPHAQPGNGDGFDVVSALIGAGAVLLLGLCGVALSRTLRVSMPRRVAQPR
jgi:hypothetical protein